MKKPRRASAGLLEEQAREVLHIGPLIMTVLARRDETGVDFGQNREPELIFGKASVRRGALPHRPKWQQGRGRMPSWVGP